MLAWIILLNLVVAVIAAVSTRNWKQALWLWFVVCLLIDSLALGAVFIKDETKRL